MVSKRISAAILLSLLSLRSIAMVCAQETDAPKYEFRGAWIATVLRLDWPPDSHTSEQKEELIAMLDSLKGAGINAVFFQVRSEADAMYKSDIEPWSYWLTGQQGSAPNPVFDPLQLAIEEAHKRGIELHAWFNPYRVNRGSGYTVADNHVSKVHPGWILEFGSILTLDPGLPEVRDYIVRIISDVVTRYDIDGVHFDDYFYPYPPNAIQIEDAFTYAQHDRGFNDVGDWRRDNVNLLVQAISDTLAEVNPSVKFGVSPFGIWKTGVPTGIVGLDAYSVIYADAVAWLAAESVDYLTPQLYWAFGGGQDYGKLAPWWAAQMNGRHLYPGHGAYRADQNTFGGTLFSAAEVPNQIRYNRDHPGIDGSVFFRAKNLTEFHTKGLADSLSSDLYRYPALTPPMAWKDLTVPLPPEALTSEWTDSDQLTLSWSEASGKSAAGFTPYSVYRIGAESLPDLEAASQDPSNLMALTGETRFVDQHAAPDKTLYYYVRTVSSNSIESAASNVVEVTGTAVASEHEILPTFELAQNFPNPFSPGIGRTAITYLLDRNAAVTIQLFDATGRLVASLANEYPAAAGSHTVYWDGIDLAGQTVQSGSYFYTLQALGRRITRGMVVVR